MARVTLTDVRKPFGAFEMVKGNSAGIADGEFVVPVGPSGEVAIDGTVVNDLPAKDRDVAMVFQNHALRPQMTVAETLGFSRKPRGVDRTTVRERVAALARSPAPLPRGAVVECIAVARGAGLVPLLADGLPEPLVGTLKARIQAVGLTAKAAVAGDPEATQGAMLADGGVTGPWRARALRDELIEAHRARLPQFA